MGAKSFESDSIITVWKDVENDSDSENKKLKISDLENTSLNENN